MIKEEATKALEYYFSKLKRKIHYDTQEVKDITGISERTLRYRLAELSIKYKEVPALLYQKNRAWKIHNSILEEFIPKYKSRGNHLVNRDWNSFITWAPRDNYCKEYHASLVKQIMDNFPPEKYPTEKFFPVLEKNQNGTYHVHLLSFYSKEEIEKVVESVIRIGVLLSKTDCRVEVAPVYSKTQAITYLFKEKETWTF